jgi:SAM-dependent methyltransferase
MGSKFIVNLGCGKTRIPGSVGIDGTFIRGFVDKVHDLDLLPYPFESASVDEVHMYHVLEHLHDPIKKLEEIHRILRLDGILYLRVPHFSSMGAFTDPTHIRPFGYLSFDCFEAENYQHFYTNVTYKVLKKEFKYFGLYPNTGIYEKYIHPNQSPMLVRPFVRLVNLLIMLSPTFFERFWCYWVGGATEVCVTLQKK